MTATGFPLFVGWPEDCAEVSAFYFASQRTYVARRPLETPHKKPLAASGGLGAIGRNTLLRTRAWGSCVVLTAEAAEPGEDAPLPAPAPPCPPGCRRCLDACPTGALPGYGIERTRCLRHHMLSGEPVPEAYRAMMGTRLLGCEICQRACPFNASVPRVPAPDELTSPFRLDKLLAGDLTGVADLIGRNYARRERVLAQACLAAGNANDPRYLPALEALRNHPRPAVALHARWAADRLRKEG